MKVSPEVEKQIKKAILGHITKQMGGMSSSRFKPSGQPDPEELTESMKENRAELADPSLEKAEVCAHCGQPLAGAAEDAEELTESPAEKLAELKDPTLEEKEVPVKADVKVLTGKPAEDMKNKLDQLFKRKG
jgi:hypothetical protein